MRLVSHHDYRIFEAESKYYILDAGNKTLVIHGHDTYEEAIDYLARFIESGINENGRLIHLGKVLVGLREQLGKERFYSGVCTDYNINMLHESGLTEDDESFIEQYLQTKKDDE